MARKRRHEGHDAPPEAVAAAPAPTDVPWLHAQGGKSVVTSEGEPLTAMLPIYDDLDEPVDSSPGKNEANYPTVPKLEPPGLDRFSSTERTDRKRARLPRSRGTTSRAKRRRESDEAVAAAAAPSAKISCSRGSSAYTGVCWNKQRKKWQASATVSGTACERDVACSLCVLTSF